MPRGSSSAVWPPRWRGSCEASTSRSLRSHIDTGDHVIIVNADKVVLTSDKAEKKMVFRHSGFPGGIKEQTYADLLARKPAEAVRRSVRGMLPKNRLGRAQLKKLKVYAGPVHPHSAQHPQPFEISSARSRA